MITVDIGSEFSTLYANTKIGNKKLIMPISKRMHINYTICLS